MILPVKYYGSCETIEDATNKIIVDCSELPKGEALFLEEAINNYSALVSTLKALVDAIGCSTVRVVPAFDSVESALDTAVLKAFGDAKALLVKLRG